MAAAAAAAAAAAQAAADRQGLIDCLTVCGIATVRERNGIIVREGKESLEAFGQFQPEDIPELVKSLGRNAPTTQRVYYSFTQTKNLQTLAFWVQERLATNQPLDAALWTAALMKTTEERRLAKKNAPAPTGTVSDLKTFDSLFYDECMDLFRNFLKQRDLAHFVRDENPPPTFADEEERRMYQYRLDSAQAEEENRQVYRFLKGYLMDSQAYSYMEPFDSTEDGRGAFLAVHKFYSGDGERSKRVSHALSKKEDLYYVKEASFAFEKFASSATSVMATLDRSADDRLSEKQKVEWLQKAVRPTDQGLQTHVELISTNYARDFAGALAYLSSQISRRCAAVQVKQKERRARQISQLGTGGRGGGGVGRGGGGQGGQHGGHGRGGRGRGGRGRGRGGRGQGGQHNHPYGRGGGGGSYDSAMVLSGVDVSEPNRNFSNDEYRKLQDGGHWPIIMRLRAAENASRNNQGNPNVPREVSGVGAQSQISQVTDGSQQTTGQNQQQQQRQGGGSERGGTNGTGFGSGAYQN